MLGVVFGVLFGPIGFAMVQIGRKRADFKLAGCGGALLGGTFLASGEWHEWIGAILLVVLGFWK